MTKIIIPKISRKEFDLRLKKRSLENVEVIRMIETFFLKKRGYIFKMPKPGTPVILMVSGGLDSTITWGILMHKYKLLVYPLFLRRGLKRFKKEKKSLLFFSKFYEKKYKNNYIKPFEFSNNVVVTDFEKIQKKDLNNYYHPERVLESYNNKTGFINIFSQNGMPITYPFYATAYANYLWEHENIKIKTIFNAVATDDGALVTSQTYTALRTTLLGICVSKNEYDWQLASLPFEKELGHWIDKSEFIRIGSKLNLPLEKTWSCYFEGKYQCGNKCAACNYRRLGFLESGIIDKTIYECNRTNIQERIKNIILR